MVLTSISRLSTSASEVSTHRLPATLVSRLSAGPDQLVTEQRVFMFTYRCGIYIGNGTDCLILVFEPV